MSFFFFPPLPSLSFSWSNENCCGRSFWIQGKYRMLFAACDLDNDALSLVPAAFAALPCSPAWRCMGSSSPPSFKCYTYTYLYIQDKGNCIEIPSLIQMNVMTSETLLPKRDSLLSFQHKARSVDLTALQKDSAAVAKPCWLLQLYGWELPEKHEAMSSAGDQ